MAVFSPDPSYIRLPDGNWQLTNQLGTFILNSDRTSVLERFPVGFHIKLTGRSAKLGCDVMSAPPSSGVRGVVHGFSPASRARLIRFLATIKSVPDQFITLTYPAEYSPDDKKRHLHNFAVWMRRFAPDCSYFWKLEYQKRGAPHYHLILWGIPWSMTFCRILSRRWYEIVDSRDPKHLAAGTNCKRPDHPDRWHYYLAKYLGKNFELFDDHTGRVWGIHNRKALDFHNSRYFRIPPEMADAVSGFLMGSSRVLTDDEYDLLISYLEDYCYETTSSR